MSRPPLALWVVVIAIGMGVIVADLRADYELSELDALRARVTAAERQLQERCFITRSPRVIAEVTR